MGLYGDNAPAAAAVGGGGIHFSEPWKLSPYAASVANVLVINASGSGEASSATAFFATMALRGLQDQTDWTADTYKTLLSVTGKGLVANIVGPTAGSTSITTFELTVDGTLTEIAVDVASGQRAVLTAGMGNYSTFTTATAAQNPGSEALSAGKDQFSEAPGTTNALFSWWYYTQNGTPLLQFNESLLIRAKHSASITNSTATAYSAVMYRKGL